MAIQTGFPCNPLIEESEGEGNRGTSIQEGHLFDILAKGVGAQLGRVFIWVWAIIQANTIMLDWKEAT